MHRHAHVFVEPLAGVVADGIFQGARGDDARAVELAAQKHHLVERGHGARRAVACAARRTALAPRRRVGVGVGPEAFAGRLRFVHVGGAAELRFGQADIEFAAEAQRFGDGLADDVAEILAGDGFDQHAQGPVGRQAVIVHLRAGRPFEREVADHLAQPLVVGPGVLADDGAGEARLVGDGLQDRDVALGVPGELRNVIGDAVGEGEQPALGQRPQRDGGHDLGVGIEQPQRVVRRGALSRLADRVAEALEQRELAVAREGDLAAGIAPLGDVPLDQRDQPVDLLTAKAQRVEIGLGQRKVCGSLGANGSIHGGSSWDVYIIVQWHVDEPRPDILCFPKTLPQCAPCLTGSSIASTFRVVPLNGREASRGTGP